MNDQALANAARRAFDRETEHNELVVARLRALVFVMVSIATVALWATGGRTFADVVTIAVLAWVQLGIWFAVRTRYQPWMSFVLPLLDATMLTFTMHRRIEMNGFTVGAVATAIAIFGLLAMSGGMRFDRRAAIWTSVLALGGCFWLLGRGLGTGLPFVAAAMVSMAALSIHQAGIVRRLIRGEQGRALFRRLLPRSVVDQVFTDPAGVTTAARSAVVTVVVTDLRGFTSLSEAMEPEQVVEMLNELHGTLADVVAAHGGSVDKFMGDGMLAVFGAPRPLENHATRALSAVIAMRHAVAAINARHPERAALRIGMGVHTGRVVSGLIGGGSKVEFTVIGDTVNIAARLEGMTRELDVDMLFSDDAARASGGEPFIPRGTVTLRGRSGSISVCTPDPALRLPTMADVDDEHSVGGKRPRA